MNIKILYYTLLISLVCSCKLTEIPATGNYAYKTILEMNGLDSTLTERERALLKAKLEVQIDDSLQVSKVKKKTKGILGFIPHNVKVYHNFDSSSISRTKDFIKAAYVANGFFRGGETTIEVLPADPTVLAKTIIIRTQPYKNHRFANIEYAINDSTLAQEIRSISHKSVLKKGALYSQDLLDAERQRITTHLRNRGYLYFAKDDIRAVVDTINISLLKIPKNAIEEQQLLEEAMAFDANPTTNVTIKLQDTLRERKLKRFIVGNIYIQPSNLNEEYTPKLQDTIRNERIQILDDQERYKSKIFAKKVFLKPDSLYRQVDYDATISALTNFGPWRQVNLIPKERGDTVDFNIYMLSHQKLLGERKIEGNYTIANYSNATLNNLYGLSISQSISNRNFAKRAIQTAVSLYGSVEFGKGSLINTYQYGLNYNMLFPYSRFLEKAYENRNIADPRIMINTNANRSFRLGLFKLTDITLSPGWQFRKIKGKNFIDNQFVLNTEYKYLIRTNALNNLIILYPSLRNLYRDGFIFSLKYNASQTRVYLDIPSLNKTNKFFWRWGNEVSIPGGSNSFGFSKTELDLRWDKIRKKHSRAFRLFMGFGQPYRNNENSLTLPFFRQFFGGGPNSMRSWGLRTLNSYSTRTTTTSNTRTNEYFGDMQVEFNYEYRFNIAKLAGIPIESALWADMGNIWNMRPAEPALVPTNLSAASRIYDDIAIAAGTSLRLDFTYFLLRLDVGGKVKAPRQITGVGGWFARENLNLRAVKFQLGIGYPF